MRLIDADELLNEKYLESPYYSEYVVSVEDILNAPTIESEPVKHAKWEMRDYYKKVDKFETVHRIAEPSFTCTNCRSACSNPFKYCPHCGAKMD